MEAGRGRMMQLANERLLPKRQSLEKGIQNIEMAEASTAVFPANSMGFLANPSEVLGGLQNLLQSIASLDTNNQSMLKKMQLDIIGNCYSPMSMQTCIQNIHNLALADPVFGLRAAAALATASNLTVDGVKMRNVLIKLLQNDYSRSEDLRKENRLAFMNVVAFLGQVFSRFRLNDEPIKVLSVPHLVYQKRLLEGDETELELCMLLLAQNGQLLAQCQETNSVLLSDFFMEIYSRLLTKELNQHSRGWLMLGYYLNTNKYTLSPAYLALFTSVLGRDSMSRIKSALCEGRKKLCIEILDNKSLEALQAGPPEEGT